MENKLIPKRLKSARERMGINKASAAALLGLSRIGYSRYESGERSPSYQVIELIAEKLNTSVEYLSGVTDDPAAQTIIIHKNEDLALFEMTRAYLTETNMFRDRMEAYYRNLKENECGQAMEPSETNGFIWEACDLSEYKGERVTDLLDSEDACVIFGMCEILKIVEGEANKNMALDSDLVIEIKRHIESACLELIPQWLLDQIDNQNGHEGNGSRDPLRCE